MIIAVVNESLEVANLNLLLPPFALEEGVELEHPIATCGVP